MIRATTGGVLRSYRKNLMSSFISQNKARDTVLTQRTFNSYAEDPASAAKCFRLRKTRMTVEGQYDVCSETYHKFQGAYQCLQTNSEILDTDNSEFMKTLSSTTHSMLNDPEGDARTQLAKALDQMSENLIQNMNQRYGDVFIFAGADGHNVPFEIKEVDTPEGGKVNRLYYRGVPVDAAEPNVLKDSNGNFVQVTQDGTYDNNTGGYYFKMDNVRTISKAEYLKTYVPPEIEMEKIHYESIPDHVELPEWDAPVEYNANGTKRTEDNDLGGGYYKITDGRTDVGIVMNGDHFISKNDYNSMVTKSQNKPQLLQDTSGNDVSVDEMGVPDAGAAGDYYLIIDGEPKYQAISEEQYATDLENAAKLETLIKEKQFVDIGLGFQEENGNLIESSAFNAALQGITFLGYGVDKDGDPKNVYSIVQRLKEISESVEDGTDWPKSVYDEFHGLVQKLEKAASEHKTQFTNFDAGTTKLQTNLKLLEDNHYNLQEQYSEMEDVDMADAITSFIWAQYCYNAALKVGNSILSESLMDYLS